MNKRSLWGLVSDVALGMIRMPLTSAESSSGRMAPQLLKPHQAIAVLLKIKSRCSEGGGREEEGKEAKPSSSSSSWTLLFLLCISCILQRQAQGAPVHTHSLAHTQPQWRLSLNWPEERMRERKNLILLTFLKSDKTKLCHPNAGQRPWATGENKPLWMQSLS